MCRTEPELNSKLILNLKHQSVLILFCGTFFISPNVFSADNSSLSNQGSATATNLEAEAATCATGEKEGTIGYAIKQAVAAHTNIAAATPDVESLFDVDTDCFSGLSSLYDLSFAIPSIGSIIGAAQDAVVKYAEKKVCSAVDKVSGMVTQPVNQAIDKAQSYSSIANGQVGGSLSKLDPDLGSEYHGVKGKDYNLNTNPFDATQSQSSANTTSPVTVKSYSTPSVAAPEPVTNNTQQTTNSQVEKNNDNQSSNNSYLNKLGGLLN